MDRPLPPLPPPTPDSKGLKEPKAPSEIFITPSSPQEPKTTRRAHKERRSRSISGRPRSHSRGRASSAEPSEPLGLGLPSVISGRSRSVSRSRPSSRSPSVSVQSPSPPPVPLKPQSVSSPFPSRPGTPNHKITFAEPEVTKPQGLQKEDESDKKTRIKRARSLSGLFGKSPPVVLSAKMGDPVQDDDQKNGEEETNGDQGGGGKLGVLEWLGVKKTVRRKASETRLREPASELDDVQNVAGDTSRFPEDQAPNKGNIDLVSEGDQYNGQTDLPPPPTTNAPHGTPKRLNSLFARRSSAKNEEEAEPLSIMVVPRAIHSSECSTRPLTNASQSSLQVPAVDPFSPDGSNTWTSSPGIEIEEMVFSPGSSAHWGPGIRPWMETRQHNVTSRSSLSCALDTPVQKSESSKAPAKAQGGRVRSFSDGPLPQQPPDHSPAPSQPASDSPSPSPSTGLKTPVRPRMDSRTGSSNSAIIGRMKSVFSKSSNRSRSNSLLRQDASDVDEFGGVASQRMRLSASASSMRPYDTAGGHVIMEDSVHLESQQEKNNTVGRVSSSSMTPSLSSNASSTKHSVLGDPLHTHKIASRRSRARASTVSLAPTSYHFAPPSPSTFPISATPPRRQSTIRRLSNGLFGSASSSPQHSALFPLPPRSNGSTSSVATGAQISGQGWEDGSTGVLSPGASPRPSLGSLAVKTNAMKQADVPEGEEPPREWLERALSAVGRCEIANVLASR